MFEFRPYQSEIIEKASDRLLKQRIFMLAMQVRTGKTLTALGIAEKVGAKKVLFVTKKKVIVSRTVHNDYDLLSPGFEIELINYESIHKVNCKDFDLFIIDESHSLGAYPKPSARTKKLKDIIGRRMVLLLTGTPTPESWSQLYHQFWISEYSPFVEQNFYKWANNYVFVKRRMVSHGNMVNDYSNANITAIKQIVSSYMITHTQEQSGFKTEVDEKVLFVRMKPATYGLIKRLEANSVVEGSQGGVILADTPVKMMQKVHQIYSGTVKLEDGSAVIIDDSKAQFIKEKFNNYKIVIYYKFKEELNVIRSVFAGQVTDNIDEFNSTDKNIALQIVSGREGISLSKADYLVFYNIDFSATSYWQARDRLTTKERKNNTVFWIFAENGLEQQIYKTVQGKKSFTTKHYEQRNKI